MSTEQNKAVVRRFITETLAGGNLAAIDEVLGPSYVNRALGADLAAFKEFLPAITTLPVRRFGIEDLVGEGDVVVAHYTVEMGNAAGETVKARGLTYYRLADGKIVEDDPITIPDLVQELGKLMPSPADVASG
jgi:predicted SnoaL-like aldol condensation-catalyzing enzyme